MSDKLIEFTPSHLDEEREHYNAISDGKDFAEGDNVVYFGNVLAAVDHLEDECRGYVETINSLRAELTQALNRE